MICDCCNQEKDDIVSINAIACHVRYAGSQTTSDGFYRTTVTTYEYYDFNPIVLQVSEACITKPWPRACKVALFVLCSFIFWLVFPILWGFLVPSLSSLALWALIPLFVSFCLAGLTNKYFLLKPFIKYRYFEKLKLENRLDQKAAKQFEKLMKRLRAELRRSDNIIAKKDATNEEAVTHMLLNIIEKLKIDKTTIVKKIDKLRGWVMITPEKYLRLLKTKQYQDLVAELKSHVS